MEILGLFPTIGCIAVICFLIGEALKCLPIPTKFIPVIVALCGGLLGVVGQMVGLPELVAVTVLEAVATGICSGLASSGAYSLVKNLAGLYPENELTAKEQKELTE